MAYYNRLPLIKYTLKTISRSQETDFEIVIVDDFSSPEHSLDKIHEEFPTLDIKVVKMSDVMERKNYCNPCVPFNVGFRYSRGDSIIIQNPECCHVGDLVHYTKNHLYNDRYLSFHCYASYLSDIPLLHNDQPIHFNPIGTGCETIGNWYNHSVYRPVAYHFASAITRKNLMDLNGFDERFAYGLGYDDNEFLHRIILKNLKIYYVDHPFVIHQYHKNYSKKSNPKASVDNKNLFNLIQHEARIRANNSQDIT